MKKLRRKCLLLLIAVLLLGVVSPGMVMGAAAVADDLDNGCISLDAGKPLSGTDKLLDTAKAAILYELESQTLVYAWNPDQRVDPSGMNKLLTALIALEETEPDTIVTVTRAALNSVAIGSVSANLKSGEEISMRDLLYCMMVGSANDAAAVIAEYVGGSQEAFVEMMNRRAEQLGCTDTMFLNPNGLTHKDQYTTARDLAKITAVALENELFNQMFCAESYTVPATNKAKERRVVTTNYLLSKETVKTQYDSRVTGGKTGALTTTDRSLICTAEYNGKRYLSVVMSAKGTVNEDGISVKTFGSFEETRVLLDYGFGQYAMRQVLQAGKVLKQLSVKGGENDVSVGPGVTLHAALPLDAVAEDITYRCVFSQDQVSAPVKKGQKIGTAQVWFRDICVGSTDLVAMHDVYEDGAHIKELIPQAERSTDDEASDWLVLIGLALVAVVVIGAVVLWIVWAVRKHRMKKRHRLINGGDV